MDLFIQSPVIDWKFDFCVKCICIFQWMSDLVFPSLLLIIFSGSAAQLESIISCPYVPVSMLQTIALLHHKMLKLPLQYLKLHSEWGPSGGSCG